ncbi:MAG: HD domain-containing phosphohydrolase [Armatimonadota bacterium]|nr:HD domain-containing protein [bacterium]
MEVLCAKDGQVVPHAEVQQRSRELSYHQLKSAIAAAHMPTACHGVRVRICATSLGQAFGLDGEKLTTLAIAAEIHDIGKLCIPSDILDKRESLSPKEWDTLRRHPALGAEIAGRAFASNPEVEDCVMCHHERLDGTGYPLGLRGSQLSQLVRIVSVADAYIALTEDRAFRKAFHPEQAVEILKIDEGDKYDMDVVAKLESLEKPRCISGIEAG